MHFFTIKKTSKDYFNYKHYYYFVHVNVNNEFWFADREVVHSYFEYASTELLTATSMKKH